MNTFISDLSKKEFPLSEKVSTEHLSAALMAFIQERHPHFLTNQSLAFSELTSLRQDFVESTLLKEEGEINELDKVVMEKIKANENLTLSLGSEDADDDTSQYSIGQRMADKIASFGGSWNFISIFGAFILLWIMANILLFNNLGFDPYPFFLLNLILSCLAALQAPVIMMSQNRQEEKDRERARKDYMINLKSELEIRMLHEKIDHLILHQQQRLLEIQKVQVEMMEDILKKLEK